MKTSIFRFIKELLNKSVKCERIGHKITTSILTIRKRSDSYGAIAKDYNCKKDACKRCGKYQSDLYDLEYITYYTSVSMPSSFWKEMDDKGYLIL